MKKFIYLFFLLAFFSCKNQKKTDLVEIKQDTATYPKIDTTNTARQETNIVISGKSLVFFSPGREEFRKMLIFYGSDHSFELQQLYRNFSSLAYHAQRPLKNAGIETYKTHSKDIKIRLDTGLVEINLKEIDQDFGFIMTDGKRYKICNGLYSNTDFIKEIRSFYGIRNFSFSYTPEKIQQTDDTEGL